MPEPESYKYFCNKYARCHPCHKDLVDLNCLTCFCPLFPYADCPGDYTLTKGIKDCSNCIFPHIPENYDKVIDFLKRKLKSNEEN